MKRWIRATGVACISLLVTLVSSSAFGFVRDPWIQDADETSVTITWEADSAGGVQELHWGDTSDQLDQTVAGELVSDKLYRATIDGLDVSYSAYYQVVSGSQSSAVGTFVTATCGTEPYVFVAAGDNRDGVATHQAVVDAILQYGNSPDFEINTGDIVNGTDYLEFFDVEKILLKDIPIFPSPGNHDNAGEYQYGFDRPMYYAYDYGRVRFIALNTNALYTQGSAQGDWLVTELQNAQQRKADGDIDWIIVYQHHPAYSSGQHGNTFGVVLVLVPLYEQYGVDVVVAGHDHNYERAEANGVTYIVTGGGGVSLRDVGCDPANNCVISAKVHHFTQFVVDGQELTIRGIDTNGNLIDEVTIDNGDPASGEPCVAPDDPPGDDPPGDDPPGDDPPGNNNEGDPASGCSCSIPQGQPARAAGFAMLLAGLGMMLVLRRRGF